MKEKQIGRLPGPYQVAELFELVGEGAQAEERSVGFVVFLPGFGRLTDVLADHQSAYNAATNFNEDFADFLTLERPLIACPLPGTHVDWESGDLDRFDDAIEAVADTLELSRSPNEAVERDVLAGKTLQNEPPLAPAKAESIPRTVPAPPPPRSWYRRRYR